MVNPVLTLRRKFWHSDVSNPFIVRIGLAKSRGIHINIFKIIYVLLASLTIRFKYIPLRVIGIRTSCLKFLSAFLVVSHIYARHAKLAGIILKLIYWRNSFNKALHLFYNCTVKTYIQFPIIEFLNYRGQICKKCTRIISSYNKYLTF